MTSPKSSSTTGYHAWQALEAQMDQAIQSPHLNPTQIGRYYITTAGLPPPYAYPSTRNPWLSASNNASSSKAPSMISEEATTPSQSISAHTPARPAFADIQPMIDGNARDDVTWGADSSHRQRFDLRGTSPSRFNNSIISFEVEGDGKVLDLIGSDLSAWDEAPTRNWPSQIQETRPRFGHSGLNTEPWSPLNTRMGNSSSDLHRSLFWKNSPVREQMHAIDTRHHGGPLVSHPSRFNGHHSTNFPLSSSATEVNSIRQHGRGPSDQLNGFVDAHLSERDPGPRSEMPPTQDDQLDEASTETFELETSQDDLVSRSNDTLMILEQEPTHHEPRLVSVYGFQDDLGCSYRQYLDNYRRNLVHFRPYQIPHSNPMTGLTRPPDALLRRSLTPNTMEHTLDSTGVQRSLVGPVRRTQKTKGVRRGPLPEDARASARDTRGEGSCWCCKIQRYKCQAECGSEGCNPCQKMRDTTWNWGCIRTPLPSYANSLLAPSLLDQHHPKELQKIFHAHIHEWSPSSMEIHVKWAHGPPIQVTVNEFMPNGTLLQFQDQYILSQRGYERVAVRSLPVGMKEDLLKDWRPMMHKYLDRILDDPDFENFPENCFRGDQNKAQRDLIHAVRRYNDASSNMKRTPILRNSLKLLVCMKLASYSLILDEKNKNIVLERMRNPSAASAYGRFTGSRFLNRQIKYVVATLHRALIETELQNLQEALQASDNRRSWGSAFISVLILSMVTEIMQHLVRCKASSDIASLGRNDPSGIQVIDTKATAEIEAMETAVGFMRSLFNRKYQSQNFGNNKGFKPIFKSADRVKLEDQPSLQLALDVENIIHEYVDFLAERQKLGPPNGSDDPCVSRLVAKFLLSCTPSVNQQ